MHISLMVVLDRRNIEITDLLINFTGSQMSQESIQVETNKINKI